MSDQGYIKIVLEQFHHFKKRAEAAYEQLSEEEIHWKASEESNSIATPETVFNRHSSKTRGCPESH